MTQAPAGTVTFLFTDIEGSTELLKRRGGEYGELLATHRRLLRACFSEEGGTEMGTEGDALFYWFPRVRQAVKAAVAAQRALAEYPWPDGVSLRVRMGLHTGEADVVEAEYVGMGVHRAARISAAAHGGQVLLSGTTAGVVADERIPGVVVQDLGTYRLKDIDQPERLFQLAIEGLASEFPPVRAERAAEAEAAGAGTTVGEAPPPATGRSRRGLLVPLLGVALLGGGAAAAAVVISGGGNKHTGSTATISSKGSTLSGAARTTRAAQTYAGDVDNLLQDSQSTIDRVRTFIQDVQSGNLTDGGATSQAHQIARSRVDQLQAVDGFKPPPAFRKAATLLRRALTLSLEDDRALEDWTRAEVGGDTATAAAKLQQVVSIGMNASEAKKAFLSEYGRVRQAVLQRPPGTLPTSF